jgi:serine protease
VRRVSLALLLVAAPAFATPIGTPVDVSAAEVPALARATLQTSALQSPLAERYPDARVPSRALVKLRGVSRARLHKALTDADAADDVRALLSSITQRTGYDLHLVRTMPFDWAVFDVVPAGSRVRLDEAATLLAVERLREEKALIDGVSAERWYRAFATPNDPGLFDMWHYDAIGARNAWDVETGDSAQRVGVVDTGTVRSHQDLSAKDAAGYDFISYSESSNDGDGRDSDWDDPGDGGDCGQGEQFDSWHGSHVAGTILASTGNSVGISGLNWNAQLVTGRAVGVCGGSNADILEAFAWMSGYVIDGVPNIDPADVVEVVNLSLGSDDSCADVEDDYISTIMGQTDVVFVAAAGNSGNNVAVGSPANCPGVISVGAHGPGSGRPLAAYSNFSSDLDIVAPGGDASSSGDPADGILSACGPSSSCYQYQQGTSMAAPHVAGAVALMRGANPSLTADQINNAFRSTGDTCSWCDGVPALRLDLAVTEAASLPGGSGVTPPPPPPGPDPDPDVGTSPDPTAPPAPPAGQCDPLRGNWDCDNGFGCREVEGMPTCVAGAEGSGGSGALCYGDTECKSGLCDNGVCTVPCDGGCRDGYRCDTELIPGGLCRAESCFESEGQSCEMGWHCAYSPADRYVCATSGEDAFAPRCACAQPSDALPLYAALPLIGLALLVRRRRRR